MTRQYQLHDNLTPGREAWLRKLFREGPQDRQRTVVGFQCMQLGWTEWNYCLPDGTPVSVDEAKERFGCKWVENVEMKGERLTESGREKLRRIGVY